MARAGFGELSEDVLVGFERELTDGAWSSVDAAEWLSRKGAKGKALEDAPVLVFHKVVMLGAVQSLVAALAAGDGELRALDEAWDEEQRTLDLELQLKERRKQPAAVREAAARVRKALLPVGTDQIGYDADKESSFGHTQVLKARAQPLAADVALLGLDPVVTAIERATDALAKVNGHGPARGRRVLAAQRGMAAACNAAYETLGELIARAPEASPRRAELAALEASLAALLSRREVSAPKPAAPAPEPNPSPTR